MTKGISTNDCHALLSYVSKHRPIQVWRGPPGEHQSLSALEEATGIPATTIRRILDEARENFHSTLSNVAHRYGFAYKLYPTQERETGPIIDVVYNGLAYTPEDRY